MPPAAPLTSRGGGDSSRRSLERRLRVDASPQHSSVLRESSILTPPHHPGGGGDGSRRSLERGLRVGASSQHSSVLGESSILAADVYTMYGIVLAAPAIIVPSPTKFHTTRYSTSYIRVLVFDAYVTRSLTRIA